MNVGNNYPTSMNKALKELIDIEVDKPNDLLGLSYIKEIIKNNYNIEPITIKRTNDYHTKELESIASATSIREAFNNSIDITNYIPNEEIKYLIKEPKDEYFKYLKYKVTTEKNLSIYNSVDEGIDTRIKNYIDKVNNLDELIENIKTKRYTYNKISRMLTHIICNYTKEDSKNKEIRYIKVLGFNKQGKNYLNNIKSSITVPLITNITKDNYNLLHDDIIRDKIYYLITDRNENVLEQKPIIK